MLSAQNENSMWEFPPLFTPFKINIGLCTQTPCTLPGPGKPTLRPILGFGEFCTYEILGGQDTSMVINGSQNTPKTCKVTSLPTSCTLPKYYSRSYPVMHHHATVLPHSKYFSDGRFRLTEPRLLWAWRDRSRLVKSRLPSLDIIHCYTKLNGKDKV